jgi:V8-like Glu-specific endopeptidase
VWIVFGLFIFLGVTSPGVAEEFVAIENDALQDVTARDPEGHWTANRLLNAAPLPVPRPSMSVQSMLNQVQQADAASESEGSSVSVDGQNIPESEEVEPDLNDRLFPELNMEVMMDSVRNTQAAMSSSAIFAGDTSEGTGTIPFDVGTLGAYFTSSQLVPTNARVHYPYRTVGKLFFEIPGQGNFICSAAVLRPRIILTAGHCVHKGSGGVGGFYRKFLFVPAYHNGAAPYQAWNWRWVITTGEWASSNGSVPNKADFAIIELEDRRFGSNIKKIGEVTGWLGYRTNALMPNHTKKLGYPANHDSGQIMHHVDSQHFRKGGEDTVLYGSDMRGGSSGGPWVENFGIKAVGQNGGLKPWPNRVTGVTSYGYVAVGPMVQGSSILNQSFLNILNTACAHRSGNC